MTEPDPEESDVTAHYVYPKKGVCDFCDGTNVRIRVEAETMVPAGAALSQAKTSARDAMLSSVPSATSCAIYFPQIRRTPSWPD